MPLNGISNGISAMNGASKATNPKAAVALTFNITARCSVSKARVAKMTLPHGLVDTPVFMPVGTQATLKGLLPSQMESTGCQIMLNNTYHLGLRPGQELLDAIGGAHVFQSWDRNILTDSGGFQMVSLLKLAKITEQGVEFESPHPPFGRMLLTPEHSISLQNSIGGDIIMQLDDVVSSLTTGPRVEEAMHRSVRWLDRCIKAHKNPDSQNLFAIIQGGLDIELRRKCVEEMVKRDTPGYAIGGLSGGEEKDRFWRMVTLCTDLLPEDRPRYCMGVGYAEDLVVCSALGVDMFDCVYPTRTARFGVAITFKGHLNVRKETMRTDFRVIEADCDCVACSRGYTRSQLSNLAAKETTGAHLLTMHNVTFQLRLMAKIRNAIKENKFPQFVHWFFDSYYQGQREKYPSWAINALKSVGINLEEPL